MQMASQILSVLVGTVIIVTTLLHTELSTSPTEPGSSFRAYFTVYSPDGSLSKGKTSSGEHVHFFAIEQVLPSQTQESKLLRENKHRLYSNFTGVAELTGTQISPSYLPVSCPLPTGATRMQSCCWASKLSACLSLRCAEQGHLCGPKRQAHSYRLPAHLNNTNSPGSNLLGKIW